MAGPFGFPWSTFAAVLVIAGSIVTAIVWALLWSDHGDPGEGGS
jgi:hypothetical protein